MTTPRTATTTKTVSQGQSRYGTAEPQIAPRFPNGTHYRIVKAAPPRVSPRRSGRRRAYQLEQAGEVLLNVVHSQRQHAARAVRSTLQEPCLLENRDVMGEGLLRDVVGEASAGHLALG